MKIDIVQGTPEWLKWRKLGGSDISCLMGSSFLPARNVLTLFKEKMGLGLPFVMNEAVQHGMDTEEEARQFFIDTTGINMVPNCFVHPKYDYMTASLDGISDDGLQGLEVKCPQPKGLATASGGKLPCYYYSQIQHSMSCSGSKMFHHWVYGNGGAYYFKVNRCEEYIKEMEKRASKFNRFLKEKKCPLNSDFGIRDGVYYDPYLPDSGEKYTFEGFRPILKDFDF